MRRQLGVARSIRLARQPRTKAVHAVAAHVPWHCVDRVGGGGGRHVARVARHYASPLVMLFDELTVLLAKSRGYSGEGVL